MELQAMQHP